ncbi:hypothetical protein D9Q98_006478 [Chlorella vulgaris]|uniref:Uncharacterized protein n=1 Tax=Chlorella vulgaris TaxID=3077 RepID=A0A9D4TKF4_CHLVU|nr:hypothetical protein D9Q98_006478 [Chlorella vulgaris]
MGVQGRDIGLCVVAFILPPLAVYISRNKLDGAVCLNILLCLIVWLPGIIHAIWVVLNHRSIRPVEQLEDATEALIPDL